MKGSSTTRSCATPNCLRPIRRMPWSASASRFCELCRARRRRHGDAAVRSGIWLKDLRPYIVRIRRLIRRGNADKVQQALTTLHTFLGDYVRDEIAERESRSLQGPPHEMQALRVVGHVLEEAKALDVGITLAAVWLMRAREPWRFQTDQVFRFDLVRMFRKLASMSFGSYWSPAMNAIHRTYRELRPATIETIAAVLIEVYARFGSRIIEADSLKRAERKEARALIDEALTPRK